MNTSLLTQTEVLWNQKLKLIPGLKAGSDNEARFFVENTATQAKYLLQGWQMTLMAGFESGELTVANSVHETSGKFPGQFDENAVRQFCQWILDEGLAGLAGEPMGAAQAPAVAHQPESPMQSQTMPTANEAAGPSINPIVKATLKPVDDVTAKAPAPKKSRPSRGSGAFGSLVKIAACVAVGIGTWKYTTTVMPIVNGASANNLAVAGNHALESHNSTAASITPTEINIADAAVDSVDHELQLKNLRDELLRVQGVRDESYEKSDEAAYRSAVQKIAKITHQMGEIQAEMKTRLTTENPGVAFGSGKSIHF